jgi:hypothetical protein
MSVVGIGFVAILLPIAGRWLADPANASLQDFVEYWAAGRANLSGENPYDARTIYRYEQSASPELTDAIMMWNPPWTLTIAMPFAVLPARIAFVIWVLLHFLIVVSCADWLWRCYGGDEGSLWLAWLIAILFVPTFFVLRMGQITPVLLLASVGFLWAIRQNRDVWAGVFLSLTAVKPHLLYLFVAAAVIGAVWGRRWQLLLVFFTALAMLTAIPLIFNPHVLSQYHFALTHQPPQMLSPTLGALLRLAFGTEKLWLQYVPVILGFVWLGLHAYKHRPRWSWAEQMPLLILVSLLTTNYGAWPFDLVVLLVPVIQVAARISAASEERDSRVIFAMIVLCSFDVLALMTMNVHWAHQYWHVWMTPMLLLAYVSLRRPRVQLV